MRYNSAVLDVFAKIMKMTNYTGRKDAELTWYSPSVMHFTWLSKQNFFKHLFTLITAPSPLAQQMTLLSSNLGWGSNWTCKSQVLKLDYIARSFVQLSNHTHRLKQYITKSARQLSWFNSSARLSPLPTAWTALVACNKILQNFRLTFVIWERL